MLVKIIIYSLLTQFSLQSLPNINKNIFPYYIKPFDDELFSSWFCRLSINHKIKPQSFILNYLNNYPILTRDIDFLSPINLILFIERHVPLSKQEVSSLFLESYNSIIFENGSYDHYYNNILNIGINHRKRKRFGLMYCPSCLQKGSYYKKSWRLQTSIICLQCKRYLEDRCPKCFSPITFHRINISNNISIMDFKPLYLCSECGYDLRETELTKIPGSLELEYQEYIYNTIKNGFNDIHMYSFSYIKVLLMLSKRLRSNRSINRFKDAIAYYYPMYRDMLGIREDSQYWSTQERRTTLPFIYSLLKKQHHFSEILERGKVSKSYLDPENQLPFWILKYCFF